MSDHAILDFLDGALPPDEEAELMHRLSVSPERRAMLRSYMNQKAFFAQDRQVIQVPYAAEQGLWNRISAVMPIAAIEETAAPLAMSEGHSALTTIGTRSVPFFGRVFTGASAAAGVAALMLGLSAGYLLGTHGSGNQTARLIYRPSPQSQYSETPAANPNVASSLAGHSSLSSARHIVHSVVANVSPFSTNAVALRAQVFAANVPTLKETPLQSEMSVANVPSTVSTGDVSSIDARTVSPASPRAIGGEDGNRPIFLHSAAGHIIDKTLLQRFEFAFTESFGRQYPNSVATNTSMPLITNSAIGVFFQVLPHSNALWVGVDAGTANITKKNIFTQAGNQLDHLQEVVASDTVHAQTGYFAAFLQYRVQAFANTDLMFTGGYGMASLGNMMIGELGLHYDVSREVGVQLGVRASRFTYDLTADKDRAIRSGSGSLVVPRGVEDASPSFNVEMNTGLFFHF